MSHDDIWILGTDMTRFGKHPDADVVDLASEAAMGALRDGGVTRPRKRTLSSPPKPTVMPRPESSFHRIVAVCAAPSHMRMPGTMARSGKCPLVHQSSSLKSL